jgi:uncharacterized protein
MPLDHKPAYHPGELAAQERAGVRKVAQSLKPLPDSVPAGAGHFLKEQPVLIVGGAAASGKVWASLLHGTPGFIQVLDEHTVEIKSRIPASDPLYDALAQGTALGTLAIELGTRKRLRVNGDAILRGDVIHLQVREMLGNCQQYIQLRELEANSSGDAALTNRRAQSLSPEQQEQVRSADTFFIASINAQAGADVSHRGGKPGFVHVINSSELLWPDYAGNNRFQTLGNLVLNPACGLLFLDFENGSTLQLSGRAEILWNDPRMVDLPGARRLVRFEIAEAVETENAFPLRWGFRGYSPHNP